MTCRHSRFRPYGTADALKCGASRAEANVRVIGQNYLATRPSTPSAYFRQSKCLAPLSTCSTEFRTMFVVPYYSITQPGSPPVKWQLCFKREKEPCDRDCEVALTRLFGISATRSSPPLKSV